jgi:hypothetical protein
MLIALALITLTSMPNWDWSPFFEKANLSPSDVQLSRTRWRGGGQFALASFNKSWDDWQQLEPMTYSMGRNLLSSQREPSKALRQAASWLDLPFEEEKGVKNKDSLVDLIVACGGTGASQIPELRNCVKQIPKDVKRSAERIVGVLRRAVQIRDAAFAKVPQSILQLQTEAESFALSYSLGSHTLDMVEHVELAKLVESAIMISEAVSATDFKNIEKKKFDFEWQTSLGKIVICGNVNDRHLMEGTMLVIDVGGDGVYVGGSSPSGCQVVVDSSGNDRYESCACALCGVSEVFDYAGDDSYVAAKPGNGAAAFGVSLLFDERGKDRYQCRDFGDGAAICGIGLLIDCKGDDVYDSHCLAQGLGEVRGVGALVDGQGNDVYNANDQEIDNPSAQTPEHNVSLSQGAGFGRRADGSDGKSMAGGVGLLVDGGGNDQYRCGVFGQGVGYWYGLGGLVDFGGADSYQGVWYVQGSAAHYALGCLIDETGNDCYEAKMHQSQGQGHDYSIGLLHDAGGINSFVGRGSGVFGTGRWNGLGLFRTDGMKSTFVTSTNEAFGYVGDYRAGESCNGLFWVSGPVNFDHATRASINGVWTQQNPRIPGVVGLGVSTDGRHRR